MAGTLTPVRGVHPTAPHLFWSKCASDLVRDAAKAELRVFSGLLRALHQRLDLPFKLFQMSNSTSCDDQRLKSFLDHSGFERMPSVNLSALDQEHDFVETTRNIGAVI